MTLYFPVFALMMMYIFIFMQQMNTVCSSAYWIRRLW